MAGSELKSAYAQMAGFVVGSGCFAPYSFVRFPRKQRVPFEEVQATAAHGEAGCHRTEGSGRKALAERRRSVSSSAGHKRCWKYGIEDERAGQGFPGHCSPGF